LSEIRATTISDAAGTGPITLTGQSAAKAYMLFDGSTNTIEKSFNIASLTDNGTGQHDGNFTSNMDSINFSAPACCRTGGGQGDKHYTNPNSAGNVDVTLYNSIRRPSMSTLTVSNIKATGETASRAVSGVAAAWANIKGDGTAAINNSANASSITDNGTGDYTVAFTNSFGNITYVVGGNAAGMTNSDSFVICGVADGNVYRTSSNIRFQVRYAPANSLGDRDYVNTMFVGDLA